MTPKELDMIASKAVRYIYHLEAGLPAEDSLQIQERIISSLSRDAKCKRRYLNDARRFMAPIGYILLGMTMCTVVVVVFTLLFLWLESLGG